MIRIRLSIAFLLGILVTLGATGPQCLAGNFLLDFSTAEGEAEGWDIIDPVLAEEECTFLGDATPCTIFTLTDQSGENDNDATLEILEFPMIGNNPAHLGEDQVYDDVVNVPVAAIGDYHYRNPDTAGTTVPMRFRNLNPGTYNVTVFEGRTTDGNGQFAKVWVGDADGSNEPGVPGEHEGKNTEDFAAGSSTMSVDIGEGEFLWYRHLEDNSGGISGIILRQLRSLELVPGDFNEDGELNVLDFSILASHFNQDGRFADGDMNFNGHVDLADFIEFRAAYDALQPAPGMAAVPEPSSGAAVLIMAGTAVLGLRRRCLS